jgi:hypothetical protein
MSSSLTETIVGWKLGAGRSWKIIEGGKLKTKVGSWKLV